MKAAYYFDVKMDRVHTPERITVLYDYLSWDEKHLEKYGLKKLYENPIFIRDMGAAEIKRHNSLWRFRSHQAVWGVILQRDFMDGVSDEVLHQLYEVAKRYPAYGIPKALLPIEEIIGRPLNVVHPHKGTQLNLFAS
jgi:hypothetical protein